MGIALLVVDVQRNMFECDPPAHDALELLARLNGLVARARAAGVPVIFVRNNGGEGDPDRPGTPGWELSPALPRLAAEPIVDKSTPDAFEGTNLGALLRARGVRHVIVCGLQSEWCVQATARGAAKRGYEVTVVEDGHTTFDGKTRTAPEIVAEQNAALREVATIAKAGAIAFEFTRA